MRQAGCYRSTSKSADPAAARVRIDRPDARLRLRLLSETGYLRCGCRLDDGVPGDGTALLRSRQRYRQLAVGFRGGRVVPAADLVLAWMRSWIRIPGSALLLACAGCRLVIEWASGRIMQGAG